ETAQNWPLLVAQPATEASINIGRAKRSHFIVSFLAFLDCIELIGCLLGTFGLRPGETTIQPRPDERYDDAKSRHDPFAGSRGEEGCDQRHAAT
ncbi:MAG: hypothetical protein ACTHJQ_12195, partial [Rhizobiaceae bacterium]